jgi:hypothetical protein
LPKIDPQELKRNLSMFTMAQRHALAVKKEDIFYNFIYQVAILSISFSAEKFSDTFVILELHIYKTTKHAKNMYLL